jgi:hypothetical protein
MTARIGDRIATYDPALRLWRIPGLPYVYVRPDEHPLAALAVTYPNLKVDN